MSPRQDVEAIEPGQEVEIDIFQPRDAPGVTACFRAVYGEAYPVRVYYHPEELTAAVERGEIIPVVARTPRGQVVGLVNLFNSAPFKGVYEVGAGLVIPAYRQRGLNNDMIKYLLETAVPLKKVPMVFGEAVCNHIFQQKTQIALGYAATALEVDLMPAAAYSQERSATGRVAGMMAFGSYEPHSRAVYLPARYDQHLRDIYAGIDLERSFLQADPGVALDGVSVMRVQVFDFAQTARVSIPEMGSDLERRLDELLTDLGGQGMEVIQAWLPLASPQVAAAVEILRARGFFLGGALPRWFDQDGLLMQKTPPQPNWEGIKIYSSNNQRIFQLVHHDWLEVQGGR